MILLDITENVSLPSFAINLIYKWFNKISSAFTADTPFGEVKLRDLPEWIGRREKGFKPFASLISRGKYFIKKSGLTMAQKLYNTFVTISLLLIYMLILLDKLVLNKWI